jgi:DNA polymerase V
MQLKAIKETKNLTFYVPDTSHEVELTFVEGGITAGFPSPADDFKEVRISLDKTLVKNGEATFYARVRGQSMIGAGIDDGDLLIVDKSIEPQNNKIAVCFLDGEFTVKRLKVEKNVIYLMPENDDYKPIKVTPDNQLVIWGVVTYVIKRV